MINFMNHNFNIESIKVALAVTEGRSIPVHTNRPSHGLVMNFSNESVFEFSDGKTFRLMEKDIAYLPKGSDYVVTGSSKLSYAINFLAGDISFPPFKIKTKNHRMFADCFKKADQLWSKKPMGYEMKVKAELYNIIFGMQQEYFSGYAGSKNSSLIMPAVEYIHNNYTNELISVEHLAELCGITSSYLRNIFTKVYGISPIKYINNLKFLRVKELIDSGIYTVSEAAYMSGFSDLSHFSREFKKSEGITPSEYLKKSGN